MCTYGQAILEEGKKQGIAIGEEQCRQLLLNLLESGMPAKEVAVRAKVPVEYVRKLAEEIKK